MVGGWNHLPICIEFYQQKKILRGIRNKWGNIFYFDDFWSAYDKCNNIIKKYWKHKWSNLTTIYLNRLGKMKEEIQLWSCEKFGRRRQELNMLQHQLHQLLVMHQIPGTLIALGRWKERLIIFCMMNRLNGDKDPELFGSEKVTETKNYSMPRHHCEGGIW